MPGARWFSGSELNYAENLLAGNKDQVAIISTGEGRKDKILTFGELNESVAAAQHGLKEMGVTRGTRIAAFVPNCAETAILMLAATATGAVWTSCSPDFGSQGVVDRFGQVKPSVMIVANGYNYNGKIFSLEHKINGVLEAIDTIDHIISIEFVDTACKLNHSSVTNYQNLVSNDATVPEFVQLPFDHPLYIMYSSGTTGPPKSIIHGAGGTLIQHLKEHQLQCDIQKERDTLFWFTTCGWMMWNWLISSLASKASIVLFDGFPMFKKDDLLLQIVDKENITLMGVSAKFIDVLNKAKIKNKYKLKKLRTICSTGSPLSREGFEYIYKDIKKDLHLSSISGGTDIVSCFVLGNLYEPVISGEIQNRGLGMDVKIFDQNGNYVKNKKGELVCVNPFPSMPLKFWNDKKDEKFKKAYFDKYKNVWCHGDYAEVKNSGGFIIYGRSDATLNPGGVRLGTSEIYSVVENFKEIKESIAVGQQWDNDVRIVLFVVLNENFELNEELKTNIKKRIRTEASPRHVPSKILKVSDIPRTKNGKIVELAVKNIIEGNEIKNKEALANPEVLEQYKNIKELNV